MGSSVFIDDAEAPEYSWNDSAMAMPTERKRGIPKSVFIIRPKVFFRDCSCHVIAKKYSILGKLKSIGIANKEDGDRVHEDFYSCWLAKMTEFCKKHKLTEYMDGLPDLCDGPHQTLAIKVVCTAGVARKIAVQGPNVMGVFEIERV